MISLGSSTPASGLQSPAADLTNRRPGGDPSSRYQFGDQRLVGAASELPEALPVSPLPFFAAPFSRTDSSTNLGSTSRIPNTRGGFSNAVKVDDRSECRGCASQCRPRGPRRRGTPHHLSSRQRPSSSTGTIRAARTPRAKVDSDAWSNSPAAARSAWALDLRPNSPGVYQGFKPALYVLGTATRNAHVGENPAGDASRVSPPSDAPSSTGPPAARPTITPTPPAVRRQDEARPVRCKLQLAVLVGNRGLISRSFVQVISQDLVGPTRSLTSTARHEVQDRTGIPIRIDELDEIVEHHGTERLDQLLVEGSLDDASAILVKLPGSVDDTGERCPAQASGRTPRTLHVVHGRSCRNRPDERDLIAVCMPACVRPGFFARFVNRFEDTPLAPPSPPSTRTSSSPSGRDAMLRRRLFTPAIIEHELREMAARTGGTLTGSWPEILLEPIALVLCSPESDDGGRPGPDLSERGILLHLALGIERLRADRKARDLGRSLIQGGLDFRSAAQSRPKRNDPVRLKISGRVRDAEH